MTHSNILELAMQGDAQAIASLMNCQLETKNITVKAVLRDKSLQIILESIQVPEQKTFITFVRKELEELKPQNIEIVKVYGKQKGEDFPIWTQEFELVFSSSINSNSEKLYINNHEREQAFKSKYNLTANDYRVSGETEILYITLGVLGFILLVLLGISFGIIVFALGIAFITVKLQQTQLLGNAVKVSENQLPEIYKAAKITAERLSMKMPDIFVKHSPELNAYAMGFLDERKTVVLHSALIEALDEDELISIIGHELSHIKCQHTNFLPLTNTAENVTPIPILSQITGYIFLYWSRKGEYTCDRAGLLASRNLKASITALAKIAIGKDLFEKINLDALIDQKRDIDTNEISKISEIFVTHPYIVNRIHELQKFSQSPLYKKLTLEN